MSEKDKTVWVNIALWIKEICEALGKHIHEDLRRQNEENLGRLLFALSGKNIPSSAIDDILKICAGLPDELKTPPYERKNYFAADALRQRLDELKGRPRDEELSEPMKASSLVSGEEFEVVGSEAPISLESAPTNAIKPTGRFMLVAGRFSRAIGLRESSSPGEIIEFVSTLTTVRKVIRPKGELV